VFDVSHLWNQIYGNISLKNRLITDISQGKLAHAYIFEGPEYCGKLTLARTVCAAMSDSQADVNKIMTQASPDVIELDLQDGKKTIGVDTVREIKSTAYIKSNDLDFKVYIINHAEALTVQAQNAMLKLIEEPPKNVYFFLLCENVTSLLATIRSRAPVLRLQLFSAEEMIEILISHYSEATVLQKRDPDKLDSIVRSSGGSLGKALHRINEEKIDLQSLATVAETLLSALASRDGTSFLKSIYALPGDREGFRQVLETTRCLTRDVIAFRLARNETEFLYERTEAIGPLAERLSLDKLLIIEKRLVTILNALVTNPNVQNLKIQLYTKLIAI